MAEYKQTFKDSNGKKDKDGQREVDAKKVAVALSYEPGDTAPKIIASGRGLLAEQIIEKSKEADVPVYQDDKLAKTLSKLEIGDMIPPELYGVVAEILVFVDDMDRLKSKVKR
ncbi:MAG: EscU/YscU/HrcU family type III secretion system export apparatus switch protein [Roseburia sp.]|nr:EscU/YscU/HrcU family type III secretion system export apparatus switch protein [Roseburia sp.]